MSEKGTYEQDLVKMITKVDAILTALEKLPTAPDDGLFGERELMLDEVSPILLKAGRTYCSKLLDRVNRHSLN